ncbi:hypothetical protein SAMN05660653_01802 [Desulfonatronum thiosulfatophilum]|uniref:Response regulatory domain-containing protein n=1 Tax=Desulfonatronum thiosulfatophilum TaxID=617002 RepID=A0A1G6CXG1_9BACT|nr:hypothetical protein [Desulfonatronum thiosulfatophilum]SDB37566.1 hypothetical protein SAMN05660653_01802 [Desulfonatronum thiosulfatophilum]
MQILIATTRSADFYDFAEALNRDLKDADLLFTNSWANALAAVKMSAPAFIILDEGLPEGAPLELTRELLKINAMINTIVVSSLDEENFHRAGEGLGILASVPLNPTAQDGTNLARLMLRLTRNGKTSRTTSCHAVKM